MLGDANRDNEKKEKKEKRVRGAGSHELSHPRRSCARFRVPPQQADLFSRLGPLSDEAANDS